MTSNDIDKLSQKSFYLFIGAIFGGAIHSAIPSIYPLLMIAFMALLLVLVLVYVNRREKELAQTKRSSDPPNNHV